MLQHFEMKCSPVSFIVLYNIYIKNNRMVYKTKSFLFLNISTNTMETEAHLARRYRRKHVTLIDLHD